ncbi:MAG: hypothetical protein V3U23_05785 [Kiloniellales bacterium]
MLRILLTVVLPMALPLLLYVGYVSMLRKRAEAAGEDFRPAWNEGPWAWFALAGVLLVLAALVTVRLSTGVPPGTKLEAPRMIDGEVVPSRVAE